MVEVIFVVVSVLASVVASVLFVEYRYKREDIRETAQERNDWYADAAELGRAVQNTWRTKFQRPYHGDGEVDSTELQREMNPYSTQLTNHASQATHLEVADEVVGALEETGDACRGVYEIQTHLNSDSEFEAQGDTVMEAANRVEERALAEL